MKSLISRSVFPLHQWADIWWEINHITGWASWQPGIIYIMFKRVDLDLSHLAGWGCILADASCWARVRHVGGKHKSIIFLWRVFPFVRVHADHHTFTLLAIRPTVERTHYNFKGYKRESYSWYSSIIADHFWRVSRLGRGILRWSNRKRWSWCHAICTTKCSSRFGGWCLQQGA